MKNKSKIAIAIVAIIIIGFAVMPVGIRVWNNLFYNVHKIDDTTNYHTRKQVEDTCRAMIASYTADKIRYEQYKTSENTEQKTWGEQAKIRANNTAAQYNQYVLKNSYVFNGNVPNDIRIELEYLF